MRLVVLLPFLYQVLQVGKLLLPAQIPEPLADEFNNAVAVPEMPEIGVQSLAVFAGQNEQGIKRQVLSVAIEHAAQISSVTTVPLQGEVRVIRQDPPDSPQWIVARQRFQVHDSVIELRVVAARAHRAFCCIYFVMWSSHVFLLGYG